MTIGIIVAMDKEFDLILSILQQPQIRTIKHLTFATGTLGKNRLAVTKSGMGKVNAAAATVEMINNFSPSAIINTGIAGALDKKLSVMDIVLGAEVVYHDVWCGTGNKYGQVQDLPAIFIASPKLLQKALSIKTDTSVHSGLIASGDQFISTIEDIQAIKNHFPKALAVDMESAAIAQTCYLYRIPFLSLRIISDTPGITNHYDQYLDFWNLAPEKSLSLIKSLLR